ncbi:MAG: C25 family cysteine peptidase [Candidatus Thermoplasmatota archaeon]|nr:C25 family cysteine peptidase [Candidatus Thermoplasmatota archaeon]
MRKISIICNIILILIIILSINTLAVESEKGNINKQYKNFHNSDLSTIDELELFDLLIITPEIFENKLQTLVEHKNNLDIKTKLVTTEKVYDEMFWFGRDKAEKIKYFIKTALDEWNIKYVLLVGGRQDQSFMESWFIPVRYSFLERKYGDYPERKFISDLYYADIYDAEGNFSSWDDDNDGIFSEWPDNDIASDIPDLYPDVSVGRLPCRNNRDVEIIVNKIIDYETGLFSESWFKNMVVVAGDTYTNKTQYIDGEVYTQMAIDNMPGFNPVKLWTSDGSLSNSWDTVKTINKGCGFIFFSGHGNPASWATHPPNDETVWIDGMKLRYMPFLFNKNKLPICITGSGCFNNMFNVSFLNHPFSVYPIPKCWGEGMTFNAHGGSIATIGSTAFSYESPDINSNRGGIEWLDIQFFKEYGINDIDVLGECWSDTISAFLDNFSINWMDNSYDGDAIIVKNVQQWLLIGDPSLKIGGYN